MKSFLPYRAGVFSRYVLGIAMCLPALPLSYAQTSPRAPLEHVVRAGDNLYTLAESYLDDPLAWRAVAKANGNPDPLNLRPGQVILIPDELLRKKPGGARVLHVSGTVGFRTRNGAFAPLERDMRLLDGDTVQTESNGFATLEMADGSTVRVSGNSELHLERLKYTVVRKRAETVLKLDRGRVESRVSPQQPVRGRFQVDTPSMAAGVRGTEFGVTVNERGQVSSDVLSGKVELRALKSGQVSQAAAGYGGALSADGASVSLAPLLPAPDLAGVNALQQRPIIDLSFPVLPGAVAYRAYIAPQSMPDRVVGNLVSDSPRLRFEGLEDGDYQVFVRAIDTNAIEGRPAFQALRLNARPEPPLTIAPEHNGQLEAGRVDLRWAQVDAALAYRLQVARDASFTDLLAASEPTQAAFTIDDLKSGNYYWRVAAVARGKDGQADTGPYNDPRQFTVRLPVASHVEVAQTGDAAVFRWDGEAGQRYAVQIAREPGFANPVEQLSSSEPQVALKSLEAGEYYLRVQATDADGFVRPFSQPQRFRIQQFVRSGNGGALRASDGQEIQAQ